MTIFENIRHINEYGNEYWSARELQEVLEYSQWRNLESVIEKALIACENSGNTVSDHFVDISKTIAMPKGATKQIRDIALSRYASYLIVQNADPNKKIVALGQTYFAIQTRRQELNDEFQQLSEDGRRLTLRDELKKHNTQLADAASKAGVTTDKDYAIFQNHGYRGLYGGLGAKEIHDRKSLKKSHKILDHMGSTELAANLFRATQTEEKLRRENIKGKNEANETHFEVGTKVRQTIEELGGTMPENLPTPEKSIQQLEKEQAKQIPKKNQN